MISLLAGPHHAVFYNSAKQLHVTVHGDDPIAAGPLKSLRWFEQLLNKKYECEHELLGLEGEKAVRVLNGVLDWFDEGIYYEADQRHAELIVEHLKFEEAKGVVIPGTRGEHVKSFEVEWGIREPSRCQCISNDGSSFQSPCHGPT